MNIQAEKLEIVRMILDTENPQIISSIKQLFSSYRESDFWHNLSELQQREIIEGIEEVENNEVVDYEVFIKKHR